MRALDAIGGFQFKSPCIVKRYPALRKAILSDLLLLGMAGCDPGWRDEDTSASEEYTGCF